MIVTLSDLLKTALPIDEVRPLCQNPPSPTNEIDRRPPFFSLRKAEAEAEPVDPQTLEKPFDRYRAGFQATQKRVHEQSVEPVMAAGLAELVDPPCEPLPGIRLVPTAGHTPGHVSVEITSGGESALITGDAFHHPCQIACADWATVADYDRDASTATRVRMLEQLEASGALMLGTHFARPTAGRIVRDGETWKLDI